MRPINPSFPIRELSTVAEVMDIALGLEIEAAQRYEQLAAAMDRTGNAETAELFRDLAALERRHADGITSWSQRESGRKPHPAHFPWQMPETFGEEGDGTDLLLLTPYRALGIAVRNEERAFSFYTYLAAMAEDRAVREHAEALATEELEHVATLRAMRRRAYHAEGGPTRRRDIAARSIDQLRALATGFSARSAALYETAARILQESGSAAAATVLRQAAGAEDELAARLAADAGGSERAGSDVAEGAAAAGVLEGGALTPQGALKLSLRNAEEVFETMMRVAEHAADEAVMREAQRLASQALARLALIRSLFERAEE